MPFDDDRLRLQYIPWEGLTTAPQSLDAVQQVFYDLPETADRIPVPATLKRPTPQAVMSAAWQDLPDGLYIFESRANGPVSAGLALSGGAASSAPQLKRLRDIDDGHQLHRAFLLYQQCCAAAVQDETTTPAFVPGDLVRFTGRGGTHTVMKTRLMRDGGVQYMLQDAAGNRIRAFEEDLEALPPSAEDPEDWILRAPASANRTALALTLAKLSTPLTDIVYSYQSSRTVFRPYQFRPVLKLMSSDRQRLLIADEVGLGKTIEAGLIWNELEQRTHLRRTSERRGGGTHFRGLVVCPAALVTKWQDEMRERFDRRLRVLDAEGMAELVDLFRSGNSDEPFAGVVSLERLRRAGQLADLAELQPRFDLVIVDEAHYLRNASSRSHAAATLLADWADALIFLSATPLNLGNQDLYNLVHLLDETSFPDPKVFEGQLEPNRHLNAVAVRLAEDVPGGPRSLRATLERVRGSAFGRLTAARPEYGRLMEILDTHAPLSPQDLAEARRCIAGLNALAGIVNRTRKADTPDRKAVRQAEDVAVHWTPAERAFYDDLHDWCLRRAARSGTAAGFAAQMWLRQAASCIPAMQQRLRERFSAPPPDGIAEAELLYEAEVVDDNAEEDLPTDGSSGLGASQSRLARELADQADDLSALPSLLRPLSTDTKFERFAAMLRDARAKGLRQAMIFSFFTRTLEYLEDRLTPEFKVRVMHGKVPPLERTRIMQDFRAGAFDLLLVSEVGSEGLDFEFCNVLVNYDLPWNPMRVEQRIGRLDRFGQQHEKIFIFNMQVRGTIETEIFQRLYTRIGVFQDSIGELEPILRGHLKELHRIVLDPRLTPDERRRQVDRIAVARADRDKDLQTLNAAQELLTGLDGLLIEGFDETSPGRGRYLGPKEIRGLVERFLEDSRNGTLRQVSGSDDLVDITGSKELLQVMYGAMDAGAFVQPRDDLLARLKSGTPMRFCFTASTSSESAVPLLSVRHPLVRAAQWWFEQHGELLRRYGRVRLPGLPPNSRCLVEVRLARADGTRSRRELWTTAVDIETLREVPEIGAALLTSLAKGDLTDAPRPLPADITSLLVEALDEVQDLAAVQERTTKRSYEAENVRLAEGRRATVRDTFRLKIEQARRLALAVDHTSISRLHASRVQHLETRRDARLAQMDRDSRFSLSTETVALVLVEGD
ncbi:DEAD/DEAH box helicase [Streptomyces sp. ISL-10]|uniref:helicase-related protein n=1 Tax=Streptomyces sp. ISL-10 TaxID=2819172 RepID=UPI001BEAB3F0|nr:helicase-related protein [Streptomyces sp. ISL-10]MBT2364264.1 DEAD/DEAH box helicase [Streptomyces sp. ISL-10]